MDLNNFHTPATFLDMAIATVHYPNATYYRYARVMLHSVSPDKRGGSHSKQGCSMDAQAVGGGYGRVG
jgi:hypothetical protein